MTSGRFVALAAITAVCVIAAILVYTSSAKWSHAIPNGVPLLENLPSDTSKITRIEVEQGVGKLALDHEGQEWVLKEHDSFPASPEKVRAFLVSLAEAKLVEAKTRQKDRYALLGLHDPTAKEATSRLVRLKDNEGTVIAELIVGNQRSDAFGTGKGGTYVRKPGDEQTWLVNSTIDAGVDLKNWVDSRLFEVSLEDVKRLSVKLPGEEALIFDKAESGTGHVLSNIPNGMTLKYVDAPDDIIAVATALNFNDVRKQEAKPGGDKASTLEWELENGLRVTMKIERDDGGAWLSIEATGEGDAKKSADALMARAKGWEFHISKSNADAMLPHRDDILKKVSS
jgi:hypothetical protein